MECTLSLSLEKASIVIGVAVAAVFTILFYWSIVVVSMGKTKRFLTAAVDIAKTAGVGLFSYATDVALWNAIFLAEVALPQSTSGQVWRAQVAADRFLNQWNYESMKEAIANARRRRLLKPGNRGRHAIPEITEAGRKRLATMIPIYDQKRVWDGRIHLITYDVPETKRLDREALRDVLRKIGAGLLQDSVWIAPYNPVDTLRKTIEEHQLAGSVIVSDLGKDGAIGEENLTSLVVRVWRLDKLNDRYEEWIREYKRSDGLDQWLVTSYLTILHNDPQLPFSLLPKWWSGDRAYALVAPKLKELYLALRPQR